MIDDISELFRMEPQVQGMQNGARGGHAEISFQVLMLVPHQACDAVSFGNSGALQSRRQLPGTPVQIAIGAAVAGTVAPR